MQLLLHRTEFKDSYTIGDLSIDGKFFCHTLEDVVRNTDSLKVYGQTAIPFGTYDIQITMSKRFKINLPLLMKVPNFTGVRIHSGNHAADTEGCLLVGYKKHGSSILQSRDALHDLIAILQSEVSKNGNISITIVGFMFSDLTRAGGKHESTPSIYFNNFEDSIDKIFHSLLP